MPGAARRVILGAGVLFGLQCHAALAAEWRYCLAPSPAQHTVYMSPPFASDQPMDTVEAAFGRALDAAALPHVSVQCPRGNVQSIGAMKSQTIQYNQASGNKVVQLNWRP